MQKTIVNSFAPHILEIDMEEIKEVHSREKPAREPLFIRRLEAQYRLAMNDLAVVRDVLPRILSEEPFSGQAIDTIYYATENFRMPTRSFIRVRIYRTLDESERSFFEIKRSHEGEIVKYYSPFPFYQKGQIITLTNINSLKESFDPEVIQELFLCMQNDNKSALYPFIKTTSKRLYFGSDKLRATIDTNQQYIGYYGRGRSEPYIIGEEEGARLELKADDLKITSEIIENLASEGVSLLPIQQSRKDHLQNLYFKMRSRLKQQENLIDEAIGYEIEGKLQIDLTYGNPFTMIDQILANAALGMIKNFSSPEGITVRQVDSQLILFGQFINQQLEEALIVVTDKLANLYALKRKLPVHPIRDSAVLIRPEQKKILIGQFEGENRRQHLEQIEHAIGDKLIEVGIVEKKKRFTTLMHKSGRFYDISVDQSSSGQRRLVQWEIEYKGRKPIDTKEDADIFQSISDEIGEISAYIQQLFPGVVEPTTLTKFEWFVKSSSQYFVL